jgi:hypothetical protein
LTRLQFSLEKGEIIQIVYDDNCCQSTSSLFYALYSYSGLDSHTSKLCTQLELNM